MFRNFRYKTHINQPNTRKTCWPRSTRAKHYRLPDTSTEGDDSKPVGQEVFVPSTGTNCCLEPLKNGVLKI